MENPLWLSLDDLRRLERCDQITKHNCIQGWRSIAKWLGVPLGTLIGRANPLPDARSAVCHGIDDKATSGAEAEERRATSMRWWTYGYVATPTILAYEMND